MVLADGTEGWTIKHAQPDEMQSNLDAITQMAKVITKLQDQLDSLHKGMEEIAQADDYTCARCGALVPWNYEWGAFFDRPFKCDNCGSTEYKEPEWWHQSSKTASSSTDSKA